MSDGRDCVAVPKNVSVRDVMRREKGKRDETRRKREKR